MANNTTEDMSIWLYFRYPSTTALMQEFAPAAVTAEKVIPPFWYVIGFLGNPISAIVWLSLRMRRSNSSAIYLGALSISDFFFLVLNVMYILHHAWDYDIYNGRFTCEIFHWFYYVPQYMSCFLVLAFTAERYVAVCHPFLKEKLCTVRRAFMAVLIVLIFSVVLASAQAYIWTYSGGKCNVRESAAAGNDWSFWSIWTWATDIFAFMLVPIAVLILNVLVLREICRISKKDILTRQHSTLMNNGHHDHASGGGGRGGFGRSNSSKSGGGGTNNAASTLTLLSVSFYLVVTQLSATIVSCLNPTFPVGSYNLTDAEVHADPTWSTFFTYLELRKIVEVICLSHYACYFFIYLLTGKHFRRETLRVLTLNGRVPILSAIVAKNRRKERYSMVSTNGCPVTENTYTNYSTSM